MIRYQLNQIVFALGVVLAYVLQRYQLIQFWLDIYDCTADMTNNCGEGIINWLNAHAAESWCVLDDEIFPDYEQLQIVEKLVKTCYMDGLTDDYVNEVIMKLTDDFMD